MTTDLKSVRTDIDEFQGSFWITLDNGAYINGHLLWGFEVFYIFVPEEHRRKGYGLKLLELAYELAKHRGHEQIETTSPTSEAGRALLAAWKKKQNE